MLSCCCWSSSSFAILQEGRSRLSLVAQLAHPARLRAAFSLRFPFVLCFSQVLCQALHLEKKIKAQRTITMSSCLALASNFFQCCHKGLETRKDRSPERVNLIIQADYFLCTFIMQSCNPAILPFFTSSFPATPPWLPP